MNPKLLDAGYTVRFHTVRCIKPQTVAEHSFRVALLLAKLAPTCRAELLKAALYHDLPETFTGDVPAQVKWAAPMLAKDLEFLESHFVEEHELEVKLSEDEKSYLKFADMAELVLYCVDEARLGNREILDIAWRGYRYLETLGELPELMENFKQQLHHTLDKHDNSL